MRRTKNAIPHPVSIRGRARLRVDGQTFWLGRFGSPEARQLEDRVIAAWLAGGRRLPSGFALDGQPPALPPAAVPDTPPTPTVAPGPTGGGLDAKLTALSGCHEITVGELCQRWIEWIKAERLTQGQDTSLLCGARQAAHALRRHWPMLARDFGPRALAEVRTALANEPVRPAGKKRTPKPGTAAASPRKKSKPKPPKPPRYRSRSTVVDVVGRVRQLFRWGVSRELVPPEKIHALASLEPLHRSQTRKPQEPPMRSVSVAAFEATIAKLPPVMADLLRVCWLTGSRPSEICHMTARHINTDGDVWTYSPPRHKNAWRSQNRHIFIGPLAQAVLRHYVINRPSDAYLFSPRESEKLRGRKPGRHHRDHYDNEQVCRAVTRVCEKHGISRWTPYALRHSRLTQIRDSDGLDAAQAVAGHRHARVTEIYASVNSRKAEQVMLRTG